MDFGYSEDFVDLKVGLSIEFIPNNVALQIQVDPL